MACRLYNPRADDIKIDNRCPFCTVPARPIDQPAAYACLPGMRLGDGHLLMTRRVPLVKVAGDLRYPGLIHEVGQAVQACGGRTVGHQPNHGRDDVRSLCKHWPCLLPQASPGKKTRPADLADRMAKDHRRRSPRTIPARAVPFRRLPIRQSGRAQQQHYSYSRYMFVNKSADIMGLCLPWRMSPTIQPSVARKEEWLCSTGM